MKVALQIRHLARLCAWIVLAGLQAACTSGTSENGAPNSQGAPQSAPVVKVSVTASDPDGDVLHYRWAATEGTIQDTDSPTTTWIPPNGSRVAGTQGLHFIYVLVSDSKGGYTEQRAGVLVQTSTATKTDSVIPVPQAPGNNGHIWGSLHYKGSFGRNLYIPNAQVRIGSSPAVTTNFKGEFFLSNVPASAVGYSVTYTLPGRPSAALPATFPVAIDSLPTSPSAESYRRIAVDTTMPAGFRVAGHVRLDEDAFCGIRNEFFSNTGAPNSLAGPVSATAELRNSTTDAVIASANVNHYGDFLITGSVTTTQPAKVRVTCENATPVDTALLASIGPSTGEIRVPGTIKVRSSATSANKRPVISDLAATMGSSRIDRPDLPKATKLLPEMDKAPGDDAFLSYKGLDDRKGACAYYKAIRAVQGCDANGFPTGATVTFDEWQRRNQLGPYKKSNTEVAAMYINSNDLNLGRDMHATRLADNHLAYVVCNYPGPLSKTGIGAPVAIGSETQEQIDESIDKMRKGLGLVACVAMEYSITQGVNNDKPFTKFLTFGPSGDLLLSISLDGRREKFIPGSCVACHGGDSYGGQYPADGSGKADIGSYFLPFDVANFRFKDETGFRQSDLEPNIRTMNTMLRDVPSSVSTGPLPIITEASAVIDRWYHISNPPAQAVQDPAVAAPIYMQSGQACSGCHFPPGHAAESLYLTAIAPNCRICHLTNAKVAEQQAGDQNSRMTLEKYPPSHYGKTRVICGGTAELERNHAMPNALVTYERFWLSTATGVNALERLFSFSGGLTSGSCANAAFGFPAPHPQL